MKLPEPVAVMDRDGDVYKALPTPNWHPPHTNLYSETQLRAEIKRRDAVLRMALEAFSEVAAWESSGDLSHPASKAIKAIQEVLG